MRKVALSAAAEMAGRGEPETLKAIEACIQRGARGARVSSGGLGGAVKRNEVHHVHFNY